MKIVLEELQHQSDALKSIVDSFPGLEETYKYKKDPKENYLIKNAYQEKTNIDIKMETGTGKTYVYTRLMYELHQLYGLNKFVIVVPSPAIKLGTKNFIESEYARREFSKFYGNTDVELSVINSGDFKSKSGRKNFPAHLTNFIEGSSYNAHVIHVMIINADMLRSASMTKSDYDQTLFGGITCPIEALKKVKPVVIVDEPHRFSRENTNYKAIESIKPQIIFRFGATFPDVKVGKGKNAYLKKDYYRGMPQYNLNAVDSFNNGLVKGIDIYYPKLSELETNNIYTVDSVKAKELTLKKDNKKWILKVGDTLSSVDGGFEGDIEYSGSKELSNELTLDIGMKLIPGTFRTTYQEMVISDAIDKHFDIEISNFIRDNNKEINKPRIKTLSLFFIDNIKSYRDDHGWLKETFERLLKIKLKKLITEYEYKSFIREKEYLDFLRATLKDLIQDEQVVHAGYFGEDRGSGDDAVQKEIDDILKNKEKLLSFKDEKGNWITRRFLFSKWTLREGWDNPNVFVIAKLRTSGSENSKIQEVGRGLRLPVDEMGRRVQFDDKESRLAFLIGYDEKEFAKKLVGEINSDTKIDLDNTKLTDDMIKVIVDKRLAIEKEFTDEILLDNLDNLNIINRKNEFKENVEINGIVKSGFEWLCEYYPEINEVQLRHDRVKEQSNTKIPTAVMLNKENWNKVKNIWKQFSNRYMIEFNRIPNNIEMVVNEVFNNTDLFVREKPIRQHETFVAKDNEVNLIIREEETIYSDYRDGLPYGYFVKELHEKTRISIAQLHKCLVNALKNDLNGENTYLSETTLNNLVTEFNKRFDETFSQVYKYTPLDFSASTSIYNSETEDFIDEIRTGLVGVNFSELVVKDDRYLYDRPPLFYDSVDPEKNLLEYNYADYVTVFGKLPKNAIKVPKYTGGFTTPDLIYVVEKDDGDSVYLLVETKADNMRVGDQEILKIQKEFFKMLQEHNIEYSEAIKPNDVYTKLKEISERE